MPPATMDHLASAASAVAGAMLSTKFHPFPSPPSLHNLRHLLRRSLLLLLRAVLSLLLSLLYFHPPKSPNPSAPDSLSPAARALSHLLSVVSRVPVASRKYDLVRALADRLLDDNLRSLGGAAINRHALVAAFSHSLRILEAASASSAPSAADGSLIGSIKSGLRRLSAAENGPAAGVEAEKTAAELVWMAGKMVESGAAAEAVELWGAAGGLAKLAIGAEPRLQVALVRVSAFLFKHVNAKAVEGEKGEEEEEQEQEQERSIAHRRMAMLTTWLPLFCRATNGTDAPILSSSERAEMVRVLEQTIEKLSSDEQEQVLSLWLHHFTSCPDSDWPNLECCFLRWYTASRSLLLE